MNLKRSLIGSMLNRGDGKAAESMWSRRCHAMTVMPNLENSAILITAFLQPSRFRAA